MKRDSRKRDDVEVVEKVTAYQGYFRIDRYRLRHRLFNGEMSGIVQREVFERGHAVAVLPFDPVREEVVIIRQFRAGAFAAGEDPWLTEIIAGIREDGEDPEETARREVQEESGLAVQDLMPMIRYMPSPGGASETVQLYLAKVDASRAGGIHGVEDEGEDIQVEALPLKDAVALLEDNTIDNSITVVALQWLALHRDRVAAAWGPKGG